MKEKSRKKLVRTFWLILVAPFAFLFTMLALVGIFARIPSFDELEHPENKLATLILADNGEILTTFHVENRTYVSYENLSPNIVNAAVATEDERFYRHSGIDFRSFARVAVKTLLLHDSSQGGGSTITQQLAKTLYPRSEHHGKIAMVWIKMKEWITAVKLERDYTKEEIVDMYLNSIFFGSGAYGIKAASETFFAKDPSSLTIEESALLVGMVNKPTRYNPILNPDKALMRRNFVIGQMARSGYITDAERDSIQQIPIDVSKYQIQDHNAGLAPYFRDMIRRDLQAGKPKRQHYLLQEDYVADSLRWADDPVYGWLNKNKKPDGEPYDIDKDGLRIYTTINYKMQKYAEDAVAEHLANHQKLFNRELRYKTHKPFSNDIERSDIETLMKQARRWSDRYRMGRKAGRSDSEIYAGFRKPEKMRVFAWNKKGYIDTTMTPDDSIRYYKGILRAGFVAMETGTGQVKAYVGGPNYRYFKYDNVRMGKRQVGSTIKPFIYTLAISQGMSPCDKVIDMPQVFLLADGTEWCPRSSGGDGATMTLAQGLAMSSNNISAFLMKQFGPAELVRTMKEMGVQAHLDEVYSLCVGSADVELFNMVSCYNIFPSGGTYITPQYVTRIEDGNGKVLTEAGTSRRTAISSRTAATMVQMMKGVVDGGTGSRLRRAPYSLTGEIAGKTGTTNDNSDGWFICYTPYIVAGAWCGCEDRQVHFQSTALGQGATAALPVCGLFLKKCIDDGTLGISGHETFLDNELAMSMDCVVQGEMLENGEVIPEENEQEEEKYYFN